MPYVNVHYYNNIESYVLSVCSFCVLVFCVYVHILNIVVIMSIDICVSHFRMFDCITVVLLLIIYYVLFTICYIFLIYFTCNKM